MNSQEYNEMAIHFKELMDKKEFHIDILKKENLDLKKIIIMAYTYARQIDEYSSIFIGEESNNELSQHAEAFRGLMSDCLDKYIFNL
jgi:hypothetical protein